MKGNAIAILLGVLIGGCRAVYTSQPVGEVPTNITEEKDAWSGTWVFEDGPSSFVDAVSVTVVDSTNGLLKADWMEDRGSNVLRHADVFLRDANGWTFATIRFTDQFSDSTNELPWARIDRHDRVALLWAPDLEGIISEGVKGEPFFKYEPAGDPHSIVLSHLDSDRLVRLTSQTNSVLFNWAHPFVLRHVR